MEKRARKLGQIRRRLKGGSSAATSKGPEERAVEAKRDRVPVADRAATRREEQRIEELRDEARYRRERLELYRARQYAGRSPSASRLRELERSYDGAAARLSRAQAKAAAPSEPDTR